MAYTGNSFNGFIREYFADVAGVTGKSLNDSIRLGLEELGYSGSLNKMLREWADANSATGTSINSALRGLMREMVGETGVSIPSMADEYFGQTTWNTILTVWEDESRKWDYID